MLNAEEKVNRDLLFTLSCQTRTKGSQRNKSKSLKLRQGSPFSPRASLKRGTHCHQMRRKPSLARFKRIRHVLRGKGRQELSSMGARGTASESELPRQ